VEFRRASEYGANELLALWNAGYTGYFVPAEATAERFARHFECAPADLERSVVMTVEGRPAGFSYLAQRGHRGWIAGVGIAPEFRGRGLSYPLMEEHVRHFRAWGLRHVQLEVFVQNWAARVYERVGFRATRRLPLLRGATPVAGEALPAVPLAAALEHHARLHGEWPASWNREPPWLACAAGMNAPPHVVVTGPEERPAGYLAAAAESDPLWIMDAAALDEAAAARLLASLGAAHPGRPAVIVNEPEGSPVHRALLAAGWAEESAQLEMHWTG
jgi:GNAT superfamily N-acetyltransferase